MKKSFWIAKSFAFEQSKKIILLVLSALYSLIVANALGPSSYGLVTFFISFTSVVMIFGIAFLQNMLSVFLPKWKNLKLIKTIAKIEFAIAVPVLLAIAVFSPQINTMLNKQSPLILSFASLHMLLMIAFTTTTVILRSLKLFGKNLKMETTMQFFNLLATSTLIFVFGLQALAVVFGQMIAVAIAIALFFRWWPNIEKNLKISKKELNRKNIEELKRYAVSGLPASIVKRTYQFLYTLLFGLFVPTVMLGYYYLAEKIFSVMVSKTATSLGDVVMPFTMEERKKENLAKILSLTIKVNFLISLVGSVAVALIMPILLFFFFPSYYNAITLVPFLAAISITRSFIVANQGFASLNEMEKQLKVNLISLTTALIFGVLFAPRFNIYALLVMPIIASTVNAVVSKYYFRKLGIDIEYIPRKQDIIFFLDKISELLKSSLKRIKMLLKR
ncbi:MAG: oligosaccharide flippase family protein [Candidatus Diapherotrites archaeon]|nr:oligosaccharide flippase family protein [Candidatus Diapherotrites archaeon]